MKQHLFYDKATAFRQLAWALLLLCLYPLTASAQQQDKLLALLRDRLKYNFSQLQKQTVKPYFMSYRVEDNATRTITSTFGVLNGNNASHVRSFIPQVRVGSMALDNYKNDNNGGRQQGATLYMYNTHTHTHTRQNEIIMNAAIDREKFKDRVWVTSF